MDFKISRLGLCSNLHFATHRLNGLHMISISSDLKHRNNTTHFRDAMRTTSSVPLAMFIQEALNVPVTDLEIQ